MAQNTPSETGSNAAGVSRRSVVRGAAWAAPAIAVAAAVPSVSASPLNDPCSPTTTNSLTSWGVNSAWPMSNNPNCGQHADVVFIFEPGIACDATQLEIVLGPLPGSNNTSDRGAIWIWDTTSTAGHRAPYGYLLDRVGRRISARVSARIAAGQS